MPKEVLLIALNAKSNHRLANSFYQLSAAEKVVITRNRIRAICQNLQKSHPKAMWIFTWPEYWICNDLVDRYIWKDFQEQFIREMTELSKQFHPNLKMMAPCATRETLPNTAHLKRIQRQYHSIKWIQFWEEPPEDKEQKEKQYKDWLTDTFAFEMEDSESIREIFNQTEFNFDYWFKIFEESDEGRELKNSRSEEEFYLAALGKFIRKTEFYTDEEYGHRVCSYNQVKQHQKLAADLHLQLTLSESDYMKHVNKILQLAQWKFFFANYKKAEFKKDDKWAFLIPHNFHYFKDFMQLLTKEQKKPLDEHKKSCTAVDAIRNECLVFENDSYRIYGKQGPCNELVSLDGLKRIFNISSVSNTLFSTSREIKTSEEKKSTEQKIAINKPFLNPVVFEPPKKANQNSIFKLKHPNGEFITIGFEICRDHLVGVLKKSNPTSKPDIHLVAAAGIEKVPEHIHSKNFVLVDDKFPFVFEQTDETTGDLQLKVFTNDLFSSDISIAEVIATKPAAAMHSSTPDEAKSPRRLAS